MEISTIDNARPVVVDVCVRLCVCLLACAVGLFVCLAAWLFVSSFVRPSCVYLLVCLFS